MHFYAQLWIFTLCLQAASALDVEDIQMPKTRFEVNEGDRLLIPCSFKTDEDIQSNNLRVEWGVIVGNNNYYRPIYRVVGSVLEPVTEPNPYEGRAQMFISLIPSGNCSLVLEPIISTDAGQYELRLYSDGEVTVNGQKVIVLVKNGTGEKPHVQKQNPAKVNALKKTVAASKRQTTDDNNMNSCDEFADFDKHLVTLTKGIKTISTRTGVSTLGLEIIAGVVTGILLMGTVAGIVLCCYFYKGIKDCKKGKLEQKKKRKHSRKSRHHQHPKEEQMAQQEQEMLQVDTPDPTTSTSPLEQCGYQMVSDTNSTLDSFDMVKGN